MTVRYLVLLLSVATLFSKQAVAQNEIYTATQDSIQQPYTAVPTLKQLIKGGVGLPLLRQSSVSPTWITFAFDVTMEQKIMKGLSIIGSLETVYDFSRSGRYAQMYSLNLPVGMRYYFSVGKRMKNRADPHSFFSHYVGIETYNTLFANLFYDTPNPTIQSYYRGQMLDHNTNVGNYSEALNLVQYAYFRIGSQFKIKRGNYLDINAVIPIPNLIYHKTEFTLSTPAVITVKYGVLWQK